MIGSLPLGVIALICYLLNVLELNNKWRSRLGVVTLTDSVEYCTVAYGTMNDENPLTLTICTNQRVDYFLISLHLFCTVWASVVHVECHISRAGCGTSNSSFLHVDMPSAAYRIHVRRKCLRIRNPLVAHVICYHMSSRRCTVSLRLQRSACCRRQR